MFQKANHYGDNIYIMYKLGDFEFFKKEKSKQMKENYKTNRFDGTKTHYQLDKQSSY